MRSFYYTAAKVSVHRMSYALFVFVYKYRNYF